MIDLAVLYGILRGVAKRQQIISYEDLSRLYQEATGDWHEPHGTWDSPLAEVNGHTKAASLPPISALVTYKPQEGSNLEPPGSGFWGSPGVPPRPGRADNRLLVWMGFVNLVHRAEWPERLPGLG
jgi:hypothetical protein